MPDLEIDGWIKIYLREIWKTPLLTREQEIELASRIKAGDLEARAHMITANLRLVVRIAQDYANYWLPLLDLISEWNIGLMKAVERFDPKKWGKLSTYAAWWIKQSIKRALANQSKTIRLPVHMVDKISKMRRLAMVLSEELGREPTDEELAEEIGVDRTLIAALKVASLRPASLDAPLCDNADNPATLGDIVADDGIVPTSHMMMTKERRAVMMSSLDILDERERRIINVRFWLNWEDPKILEDLGNEFGVTRERVRQIQNLALKKLRRAMEKKEDPGPKPLDPWVLWLDEQWMLAAKEQAQKIPIFNQFHWVIPRAQPRPQIKHQPVTPPPIIDKSKERRFDTISPDILIKMRDWTPSVHPQKIDAIAEIFRVTVAEVEAKMRSWT